MSDWIQFVGVTLVIFLAGSKLSRYADVIADKTGAGRTMIGLALLAWITSLPELMTGVSSVVFYRLPEIAVGDVLGSCMFNLLILVLVDFLHPGRPVLSAVRTTQRPAAIFGVLLLALINLTLVQPTAFPSIFWLGWNTVLVVPIWFVALHGARRAVSIDKLVSAEEVEPSLYPFDTLSRALVLFAIFALVTVVAATYLPLLGEQIAEASGLGQTFVGTILVGLSTSLPEVVVAVAAVRIGAADLAVANVLGSNLFNIVILGVDDLLYGEGPILEAVSRNHIIPASAAGLMTIVVLIGLSSGRERKVLNLSHASWGILAVYVLATTLLLLTR